MGENPIRQGSFQSVAVGTVSRMLAEQLPDDKGSFWDSASKQAVTSGEGLAGLEKRNAGADSPEIGGRLPPLVKENDIGNQWSPLG